MVENNKTVYKIMIVDDDTEVLKTLIKMISKRGYQGFPFESASNALDFLKVKKMDLIIVDLKMPEIDGIQFLDRAKRIHFETPVILITGFSTVDTAVLAMEKGAFDYISKPFELKKIYGVILRALRIVEGTL